MDNIHHAVSMSRWPLPFSRRSFGVWFRMLIFQLAVGDVKIFVSLYPFCPLLAYVIYTIGRDAWCTGYDNIELPWSALIWTCPRAINGMEDTLIQRENVPFTLHNTTLGSISFSRSLELWSFRDGWNMLFSIFPLLSSVASSHTLIFFIITLILHNRVRLDSFVRATLIDDSLYYLGFGWLFFSPLIFHWCFILNDIIFTGF